ncbi:hypothetical protein M758_3G059500 [Ceratodon purpureus]|nr:hypothetical protein M758_3G059500 [Ceratodon purpureus]
MARIASHAVNLIGRELEGDGWANLWLVRTLLEPSCLILAFVCWVSLILVVWCLGFLLYKSSQQGDEGNSSWSQPVPLLLQIFKCARINSGQLPNSHCNIRARTVTTSSFTYLLRPLLTYSGRFFPDINSASLLCEGGDREVALVRGAGGLLH